MPNRVAADAPLLERPGGEPRPHDDGRFVEAIETHDLHRLDDVLAELVLPVHQMHLGEPARPEQRDQRRIQLTLRQARDVTGERGEVRPIEVAKLRHEVAGLDALVRGAENPAAHHR